MRLENQSTQNDRTERLDRSTDARSINGGLLGLIPIENGLKTFKSIISKQHSELTNMFPTLEITENSPLVSQQEGSKTANPKATDKADGRRADEPKTGGAPDWSGVKDQSGGSPYLSGVKHKSGGAPDWAGAKDQSGAGTAQLNDVGTYIDYPVGRATREKVELLTQPYRDVPLGKAVRRDGGIEELYLPDQGYPRTRNEKDSSEQSTK